MVEVKHIAKTVAEAQVGEWLWRLDRDANRYGANGKYEGRGVWTLVQVTEVIRLSLVAGGQKYDRKTGTTRPRSTYGHGGPSVRGSSERTAEWWGDNSYALAGRVKQCHDVETLRAVAFILGFEGPPDFSVDPDEPAGRTAIANRDAADEGGRNGEG